MLELLVINYKLLTSFYIENSKDKFFDKIENTYDYIEENNKLAHGKIVMELKTEKYCQHFHYVKY